MFNIWTHLHVDSETKLLMKSGHLKCYYFTDQYDRAPVGFTILKYTKESIKLLISVTIRVLLGASNEI